MLVAYLMVLAAVFAKYTWYESEPKLLTVSNKKYDKSIIYSKLQQAFENKFKLKNHNHARIHLGDMDTETKCIKGTEINYYLKGYKNVELDFEASECRINMNPHFKAILNPTDNLELFIHQDDDPIKKQLENSLMDKFKAINFYNFDSLDYKTECTVGYQDIGQIILKETAMEFAIQEITLIPEICGFTKLDSNFDGNHIQSFVVQMPVNATFQCTSGTSPTCRKSIAEFTHPHYRLLNT